MRTLFFIIALLPACVAAKPAKPPTPAVPMVFDNVVLRQCRLPIPFVVSTNIDEPLRQTVVDGLEHWNTALNQEIFVYLGTLSFDARKIHGDVLTISMVDTQTGLYDENPELAKSGRTFVALSVFRRVKHCITNARILLVKDQIASLSPASQLTTARHEAGHILGLADNPALESVMHGVNDGQINTPKIPLRSEVRLLRQYYRHIPKRHGR